MQRFLDRHKDRILGVLCGFDRVLFRGTLRMISHLRGMNMFLSHHSILYKDFGKFAERVSERVKTHAQQYAEREGRPYVYIRSPKCSKEDIATEICNRDGVKDGLICVLACVEPCRSFALRKDPKRKHLVLEPALRQCLFLYFYYMDREFGLIHVRLQTWLPLDIQVCLNGREYLARRLDRAGIGYEQRDNCFARIDDVPRAQRMLDDLYRRDWPRFLSRLAARVNPWLGPAGGLRLDQYYWSIRESEVATDVMFRSEADLAAIYPALVSHAIQQFNSETVMRFLGRRTNSRFNGEVVSDVTHRSEGTRVKHRVEENSIKMYDKQGSVLRIETTINNPRRFKVRRRVTRRGQGTRQWVPLRKGVADITRRGKSVAPLMSAISRRSAWWGNLPPPAICWTRSANGSSAMAGPTGRCVPSSRKNRDCSRHCWTAGFCCRVFTIGTSAACCTLPRSPIPPSAERLPAALPGWSACFALMD